MCVQLENSTFEIAATYNNSVLVQGGGLCPTCRIIIILAFARRVKKRPTVRSRTSIFEFK